ncbi:NAD-dependent epimerase/dehydratase family protein [Waterburya agarophytonicola K14]|uniref:NAD-dependent epimerase/dehydratase family protein n=1 Tax=Waterburya agarophytonicola KI4 TaxID=2874699 RepID=A0A964FE35_9CYAN|nr:NAD-dependent epimerase/dehydratase family protein [Waterburya agarophytonicola]MCC0176260.1 NAD-dependent epimerase/dehydratase family protein [Waterburya agarophytonicola KI4]
MQAAIIGCGYVGSAVARKWHQQGELVTVTTTSSSKKKQLQAIASEVVVTTGNDLTTLKQVVAEKDVVLLSIGAKQRTPEIYHQAYLTTAKNVVTAIRASKKVRQLIYTSSYGILGNQKDRIVDETAIPNPTSEYGEILAQTEQVLLSVPETEFKTCIFRLSGIYGDGRELIKIFGKIAGTTKSGMGERYTNWVHLDDIVGAIDFARQQQLQGIYNLASEQILTQKEFFQKLFQAHNLPLITWDESQGNSHPYNMQLSGKKIKDAGYQLIHPKIKFI